MNISSIPESVSEYLRLDISSPSGLVWKKRKGSRTKVGKQAGSLHKENNRYSIRYDGKLYYCYRVVYYLRTGEDPGEYEVDHKTHETHTNNDLRLATHAENMSNHSIHRTNTSGFRGVSFDKKTNKWAAYIYIANKKISLGFYPTKQLAAHAFNAAAVEYRGDFACLNVV